MSDSVMDQDGGDVELVDEKLYKEARSVLKLQPRIHISFKLVDAKHKGIDQ